MYTEQDIEVLVTYYERSGLEIGYSNLKTGAAGLQVFSRASLTSALYSIGYITDYDAEQMCVPLPTDSAEGVHNWISLDDFIRNNSDALCNLDEQIAVHLVLDHKNNSSKPQTNLLW